jgi:hypothetical protein
MTALSTIRTQLSAFNPKENKFLTILMGALLWGFAWQIRGSGTSDPSVVILLFLLFLSIHYSPRHKFNLIIFALAIFVFGLLRTGWGTFVAQAGIPGLYPGHIVPDREDILRHHLYDIVVPWWHGYMWLFIVGIAWAGFPALIFGGYFFTQFQYSLKDLAVGFILFATGRVIGGYVAEQLIPLVASAYYHEVYLAGLSKRNYQSMYGNLATALAIVPVLFYVYFQKRDKGFVKRSVVVMVIFGIGLSGAAIWHGIGRNHPQWQLPYWSLWEYSSGFIIGGLIFWFYGRLSEKELQDSDLSPGLEFIAEGSQFDQFVIYATALYYLVLYGLQESIAGSVEKSCGQLGVEPFASQNTIQGVLLVVVLPCYYFYLRGDLGVALFKKPFCEKCLIAFVVLLPIYYLIFAMPHIVTGKLFEPKIAHAAVWLDTISFVAVESYGLYWYRRFKRSLISP